MLCTGAEMLTVAAFCTSVYPMPSGADYSKIQVRYDTKIVVWDSCRLVYSSIIVVISSDNFEKVGT